MKAKIRLSVPADAQALRSVDSEVPANPKELASSRNGSARKRSSLQSCMAG